MNSGPIQPFIHDLRQNQLLTAAQLAEITGLPAAGAADPRPLAKELLQRGWLTPYQVNQVVQGRGKELVLGPYRLLDRLGEAHSSKVFKARHVSAERLYAVKVLAKALIALPNTADSFTQHITRIQGLKAPFLARVFDAPVVGDNLLIVSEFIEGTDLGRLVQKSGSLPVAKALDYVRQVAAALQFLHQGGFAHRNIKPSNLLLCQPPGGPESVKLLDLAQAPFGAGDIRADLFALGGTWFFLLTGQMPKANSSFTQMRPDVPPPAREVLAKLLARRPEDRFQTPADLLAALRQTVILPPAPVTATAPTIDRTLAGEFIVQTPAASPTTDQTLAGEFIAQRPAPPPRKSDLLSGQTLMGDFVAQAPPAPPKEKTILGELVPAAAPPREKTVLGEMIGSVPAGLLPLPEAQTGDDSEPVSAWHRQAAIGPSQQRIAENAASYFRPWRRRYCRFGCPRDGILARTVLAQSAKPRPAPRRKKSFNRSSRLWPDRPFRNRCQKQTRHLRPNRKQRRSRSRSPRSSPNRNPSRMTSLL